MWMQSRPEGDASRTARLGFNPNLDPNREKGYSMMEQPFASKRLRFPVNGQGGT